MKKIIIATLCSILFFSSCKKSNSPDPTPVFQSYLKFKLDGVTTECTSLINATYFAGIPDSVVTVTGAWANGSIAFRASKKPLLTTGTYPFMSTKWDHGTIWTQTPAARYVAGADTHLSSYGGSGQIIITEQSSQYVKGTFEFITVQDPATGIFKTVTDGEFHIKRG
ncbi:hypothetical protein CAP36_14410 [Chitinophagaceae bacterium IBVUCB2]|nr:hypothetical protein CAP36_14410 [Chitinophagaceae bacterium IBVUCB2]